VNGPAVEIATIVYPVLKHGANTAARDWTMNGPRKKLHRYTKNPITFRQPGSPGFLAAGGNSPVL